LFDPAGRRLGHADREDYDAVRPAVAAE
jgi:hypothetical protein